MKLMTRAIERAEFLLVAVVAGASVVLALGCSTIKTSSDYDPAFDFSTLSTYGWLDQAVAVTGSAAEMDNTLLDKRIRRAVDSQLQGMGYRRVANEEASFLASYHIGVKQKLDVSTIHSGSGYGYRRGWYGGYSETQVRQYEEGTLLLDFIEPKERQLLWRGSGSARVSRSKTPEQREARVQEAVTQILKSFPPGKKK
jgi:hypothetical protein